MCEHLDSWTLVELPLSKDRGEPFVIKQYINIS